MATTVSLIRSWLEQAKENGAIYVIVACDTFDWSNYPVEVGPEDDFYKQHDELDGKNMQMIVEVYDLSMDLDAQLAERRAHHPPPKP
ncbi:MAG: hypothetical protein PHV43_02030 [Candidatus Colwellbacteria bacterium]|nr:hypothetical protein [Candidatus Colwellbacteria bacterium]